MIRVITSFKIWERLKQRMTISCTSTIFGTKNSILEYLPAGAMDNGNDFCTSSGCQFGMSRGARHSSSTTSGIYNMGVSEYAKPSPFSSPEDSFAPFNSKKRSCPLEEGEPVEGLVPLVQDSRNLYTCEDFSLEEYILHELEMVTSQFTEKTRKCVRDAMYRLAQNSIDEHSECYQDAEYCIPIEGRTSGTDPLRSIRHGESGGPKEKELETNSIDRVIATLMFDKMDFNLHDTSTATSANSKQQMVGTATGQVPESPFSSTQIQNLSCMPNSSQGDVEVQRFSHMDQQTSIDVNQNDVGRSFFMLNFASVT